MTTSSTGTVIVWDIEQSRVVHSKAQSGAELLRRQKAGAVQSPYVALNLRLRPSHGKLGAQPLKLLGGELLNSIPELLLPGAQLCFAVEDRFGWLLFLHIF